MNLGFENGFTKIYDCNTYNINDKNGIIFLINIAIIIILFLTIILCYGFNNKKYISYMIILFSILLCVNIYYYSQSLNTIIILHAFSFIISSQIRTPEFLKLDKYFKNHKIFEDNYVTIKKEVIKFIDKKGIKNVALTRDSFSGANSYIGSDVKKDENGNETGWRLLTLKVGDEITGKCYKYFPKLAKILNNLPEVISCVLSILEAGVMIPIHVGYYKGIIRYMLPLVVPDDKENCFLWVNGLKYSWTEGKGVLWDDIYPHKVYNNTKQVRILLYMDIVRPIKGLLGKLNSKVLRMIKNSKIVKDEIKRTEKKVLING